MGACGIPSVRASKEIVSGISMSIWDLVDQNIETSGKGVRGGQRRGLRAGPGSGPAATLEDQENQDETVAAIKQSPRIVGGQLSEPDTWPWQVHLTICGRWYGFVECNVCGASIIRGVAYKLSSLLPKAGPLLGE